MVETINDIRSQLKVSLERRVAEMSAPCLRLFCGQGKDATFLSHCDSAAIHEKQRKELFPAHQQSFEC